jgi:redox-sensitive bicupin YhaK (pirin superfamily)
MVNTKNNSLLNKSNADVRTVARVWNSTKTVEGEGLLVHRSFPTRAVADVDPFMLLDEMGPMNLAPGEAKGAPDHPHRGFETVTYLLDGRFEHKDSQGNSGKLAAGDVQWMTAGQGVIHSEMPEKEFAQTGGRLHGFQLWVNLPRRDKMAKPRYQDIKSDRIPVAESADRRVRVRVIAGESLGRRAVIDAKTPILYLHFTLQPGSKVIQPVPQNYNAFAYVVGGEGLFGQDERRAQREQVVQFGNDGGEVAISVPDGAASQLDVLLIAGAPLNEPVARYGPFVMNTEEEIQQAMDDYRSGRMGKIEF